MKNRAGLSAAPACPKSGRYLRRRRIAGLLLSLTPLLAGCGGGGSASSTSSNPPPDPQNTTMTLLLSSTGNDRLSQLRIVLSGLTLTSSSGQSVNVPINSQEVEFVHLNGKLEPLLTATVPQGVYVSALLSASRGDVTCVTLSDSGSLQQYTYGTMSDVSVSLPAPVTLGTAQSELLLNLDLNQSVQFPSCEAWSTSPPLFAAAFKAGALTAGDPPSNSANGLAMDLSGILSSVDTATGNLGVGGDYALSWLFATSGTTSVDGVSTPGSLLAGMAVDVDVAVPGSGPWTATRVSVPDTDSADLNTYRGVVMLVDKRPPTLLVGLPEVQGALNAQGEYSIDNWYLDTSAAIYRTSSRYTNLADLPFSAQFGASSIVAGQAVYVTNHVHYSTCCKYDPAATITLMPQTLNGTITAVSTAGGFTSYTLELASYDLFPTLAAQAGQTSGLQQASTVVVYVDSRTQKLNTTPLATGSLMRFNGLVFDDNGALRMDCSEIYDGAAL